MSERENQRPEPKPARRRYIIVGGSDVAVSVNGSSPRARRSLRPRPENEALGKPPRRRPED